MSLGVGTGLDVGRLVGFNCCDTFPQKLPIQSATEAGEVGTINTFPGTIVLTPDNCAQKSTGERQPVCDIKSFLGLELCVMCGRIKKLNKRQGLLGWKF